MTTTRNAKSLPFRQLLYMVVPSVVSGLVVFAACFMVWYHVGGGAWRSWVSVEEAQLIEPDKLSLIVNSCEGTPPRLSMVKQTVQDIQVKLYVLHSAPRGGQGARFPECLKRVEVYLDEPLGNRVVVDKHTGQLVSVTIGPVLTQPQLPPEDKRTGWEAVVQGIVVFDENAGCLYLGNRRDPVVWPGGASWQADPPAVKLKGQLIEPGMSVEGAGRYLRYGSIKMVAGEAVADAAYECADRSDPHKNIAFFNKGSRVDVVP